MSTEAKQAVHDLWERASCGEEAYARGGSSRERLEAQARARYELEPYIRQFARFESGRGLDVLEVGVGMSRPSRVGAPHAKIAFRHRSDGAGDRAHRYSPCALRPALGFEGCGCGEAPFSRRVV